MFADKRPLRMSIAHIFSDLKPRTSQDVFSELEPEYGGEGQFTHSAIENHLMSLKAVGILKENSAHLTAQETLIQSYEITSFGIDKLKSSL